MGKVTIEEIETLVNNNQINEAKKILLQEGFINKIDIGLQKEYIKIIPETEELKKEMRGSLRDILNDDLNLVKKAANYIYKETLKEYTNSRNNWLGDPRTVNILIKVLNNCNDKKVQEDVIGSLCMISNGGRYLKDLRIYNKLMDLLQSKNKEIVRLSASGLFNFSFDSKWDALIVILENTKNVRITKAILKNIYIKSRMGIWGEITNERKEYLKKKLPEIYNSQNNDKIKFEIGEAIEWIKNNLN